MFVIRLPMCIAKVPHCFSWFCEYSLLSKPEKWPCMSLDTLVDEYMYPQQNCVYCHQTYQAMLIYSIPESYLLEGVSQLAVNSHCKNDMEDTGRAPAWVTQEPRSNNVSRTPPRRRGARLPNFIFHHFSDRPTVFSCTQCSCWLYLLQPCDVRQRIDSYSLRILGNIEGLYDSVGQGLFL